MSGGDERTGVTRDAVLGAIDDSVRPLGYVHSFWEGGAASSGRLDEWSDMDLYLLVDDGRAEDAFLEIERGLSALSPIDIRLRVPQAPAPGVTQTFYRLRDSSKFLLIDLAVIDMSAPDKFLTPEIHGEPKYVFNRMTDLEVPPLDTDALAERMSARRGRLATRMALFGPFVEKELRRGNLIEAVHHYNYLVLGTLTELLRMKHRPEHWDFGIRYVHQEFPQQTAEELQKLYFVRDVDDLRHKLDSSIRWIDELQSELGRPGSAGHGRKRE